MHAKVWGNYEIKEQYCVSDSSVNFMTDLTSNPNGVLKYYNLCSYIEDESIKGISVFISRNKPNTEYIASTGNAKRGIFDFMLEQQYIQSPTDRIKLMNNKRNTYSFEKYMYDSFYVSGLEEIRKKVSLSEFNKLDPLCFPDILNTQTYKPTELKRLKAQFIMMQLIYLATTGKCMEMKAKTLISPTSSDSKRDTTFYITCEFYTSHDESY